MLADVGLPAATLGTFTNADRTVHISETAVDPPGDAPTWTSSWTTRSAWASATTVRLVKLADGGETVSPAPTVGAPAPLVGHVPPTTGGDAAMATSFLAADE